MKTAQAGDGIATAASRRQWLFGLAAAATIARAQQPITIPGKQSMLVHNDQPEDLETPLARFETWLTPNDVFFVRQHLPRPQVNENTYALSLQGRVTKPLQLSLAQLRKLPQHTVAATLECTGNARGFFRPRVPGIQWGRGAIGNAEWSGPRLSDVLKLAESNVDSAYVTFNGADSGVDKTPDFIRSFLIRKALHPATLLAVRLAGDVAADLHRLPVS